MTSLFLALAACGQLTAPLDDAACLYRAQAFDPDLTFIPNEGTRAEPLLLGPTLGTEASDPEYVLDPVLGGYLRYVLVDDDHATSPVPVDVLNGDVTFAIRYRPEARWNIRLLLSVVDPDPQVKHFMLHVGSDNKYMSRFWGSNLSHSQIVAQGTSVTAEDRTDTVVVTWDSASRENKLYVNGVLEATGISAVARSDAAVSPLQMPSPGTTIKMAGKVFSMACWERCFTAGEVSALLLNEGWYEGGGIPPPPPPPGQLIVKVNGTALPPGTIVKIDGVSVDPPSGPDDKIVEVEEP